MKTLRFFVLLSLIAFAGHSADISITGTVLLFNQSDNSGITVHAYYNYEFPDIETMDAIATTTENGTYSFTITPINHQYIGTARLVTIEFSKEGYTTKKIERLISSNTTIENVYLLKDGEEQIQELCFVTKDSKTQNNLVLWEPIAGFGISSFIIQKKDETTQEYYEIGTQLFGEAGVFEDTETIDSIASFYRVVPVFNDGTQGIPSHPIRSVVLKLKKASEIARLRSVTLELNAFDGVDFDQYEKRGIKEIIVEKGLSANELTAAFRLDYFQLLTGTYTGITDTIDPNLNYIYRVAVTFENQCNPLGLKSDSGPFSQSLSNLAESGIEEPVNEETNIEEPRNLTVIQTIVADEIQIKSPSNGTISLYEINGKLIQSSNANKGINNIDISTLSPGCYKLKFTGKDKILTRTFIVN